MGLPFFMSGKRLVAGRLVFVFVLRFAYRYHDDGNEYDQDSQFNKGGGHVFLALETVFSELKKQLGPAVLRAVPETLQLFA